MRSISLVKRIALTATLATASLRAKASTSSARLRRRRPKDAPMARHGYDPDERQVGGCNSQFVNGPRPTSRAPCCGAGSYSGRRHDDVQNLPPGTSVPRCTAASYPGYPPVSRTCAAPYSAPQPARSASIKLARRARGQCVEHRARERAWRLWSHRVPPNPGTYQFVSTSTRTARRSADDHQIIARAEGGGQRADLLPADVPLHDESLDGTGALAA
jgi:hypothetical protein